MGRYVPPDQEGVYSANQLSRKHPLGARANKLASQGILTVRFEMPFAVWCDHCRPHPQIIGQGVRFNAEKKKVGNYFSTPIFSFRMKHTICGGWIEIRTDPKNTAYVVTEGGRKRDTGEDKPGEEGEIRILSPEEREKLQSDAFARLENTIGDRKRAAGEADRIEELRDRQRVWEDPYEASRRLRRVFREGRKVREKAEERSDALKEKMSLGIELLEEREEDGRMARLIEYGEDGVRGDEAVRLAERRGIFDDRRREGRPATDRGVTKKGKKRKVDVSAQRLEKLKQELGRNTRANLDPFLTQQRAWQPGIKQKREEAEPPAAKQSPALVDYDSD